MNKGADGFLRGCRAAASVSSVCSVGKNKNQDDKIYVFTYKTKDKKQDVLIMDLNGKELGWAFATIAKINTIANGNYYYLKDNVDKEEWELHWEKLH